MVLPGQKEGSGRSGGNGDIPSHAELLTLEIVTAALPLCSLTLPVLSQGQEGHCHVAAGSTSALSASSAPLSPALCACAGLSLGV